MKKIEVIILVLALVSIVLAAIGQDIQPTLEYPFTVASQTQIDIASAGALIPPLAERRKIKFYSLSASVIYINTATTTYASGTGVPVYPYGTWEEPYAATVPVSIGCDVAASGTVVQQK
jgi:hypothetical protein